jgi:adenosine kinase
MKQNAQVLVAGSLAYDHIMDFPGVFTDHILPEKLHTLSVSFGVENVRRHFGGTAGNIAYTLAQLQTSPMIVSQLGQTDIGYLQRLKNLGITTKFVRLVNDETAQAWIMTDKKDNQIAAFHGGAMKQPATVNHAWKKQKYGMAIISSGNSEDHFRVAEWCRQSMTKTPFIFDPGQRTITMSQQRFRSLLAGAKILILNDYELELAKQKLRKTLTQLLKIAPIIITTLGAKGSRIDCANGDHWNIAAVRPKRFVDPTGAGDAYRAGLIAGLLKGLALPEAARWGAQCASKAIEAVGTQEHKISLKELRPRTA